MYVWRVFIVLKEEMVLVVCLVQVFTWAVNILTDPTSTNQFGFLSLTALKKDVNRIEDEKHLKPTTGKKNEYYFNWQNCFQMLTFKFLLLRPTLS